MEKQTEIIPLFGEVVVAQATRPNGIQQANELDRMKTWADAFDLWMSSLKSNNTRRAYRKAWDDFLFFVQKSPWMIGKSDCARWVEHMKGLGLSDCTRQLRIAAISAFYRFASTEFTSIGPDGREVSLFDGNPAGAKSLRPNVDPYGKAIYLSTDESRALLRAIKRDSVQGLRDFALFVTYMFTGRRNSEVRLLQRGAIEEKGGRAWYRWSGKRKKDQLNELPLPAWTAIQEYLKAAGRLESMTEDSYIFTALTNRAARLPTVTGAYDPHAQPLSMREVGRLLKVYCKRAGLNPEKVHVHTLRHTAAMLRREAGDDVEDISRFLAHSSLSVTQIYLHRTEGKKDESWAKVESLLGL